VYVVDAHHAFAHSMGGIGLIVVGQFFRSLSFPGTSSKLLSLERYSARVLRGRYEVWGTVQVAIGK
jgi:hypothetical protein